MIALSSISPRIGSRSRTNRWPAAGCRLRSAGVLLEIACGALSQHRRAGELLGTQVWLCARTGPRAQPALRGWAAGVYLAALALKAGQRPAEPLEIAGDDRFVTDYLRAELLSALPRAEVVFLTRTSVLDRMTGALCDAVLERSDSARRLESIERSNLFLVPLDHRREWYRYHHLFRDMLRAELDRREPRLAAQLSERAAEWCESHDMIDAAIAYADAAGDVDRVARLVGTFTLPMYRGGRAVTLDGWFQRFDDPGLIRRYPVVGTLGVWLHALRGRDESAVRWLAAVEGAEHHGPLPDGSASIGAWIAMLRALLGRHGPAQMQTDAEAAISELGAASPFRPLTQVLRHARLMAATPTGQMGLPPPSSRQSAAGRSMRRRASPESAARDRADDPRGAEAHVARAWLVRTSPRRLCAHGDPHAAAALARARGPGARAVARARPVPAAPIPGDPVVRPAR
jgi:ATP/maltotriose-dependent transcriptional regulator MalT